MPGIAGILAPAPSAAHESAVRRMVATMEHQPESETGLCLVPESGVYAGWVAHAGSYAARQSTARAGVPAWLVFSGECLGADATALLARHGRDPARAIAQMNGLFTGLWINNDGDAWLFNDRFGSERLYVHEKDGTTYFASEAKALLAVLPELRAFDETGVAQFLAFGSTLQGHTLFRGLRLAPGGSLWRWRRGRPLEHQRYFTPAEWECLAPWSAEEFETRFNATFPAVLPDYLERHTSVGLSLTGGLDTRMIAACLPHSKVPGVAYTYSPDEHDRLLDLAIARRIASMAGMPHHALRLGPEFLRDFRRHLDRTVYISDGCAGVLGSHELPFSEQARCLAPIRLTGNYGSEVLRSMSTFKRVGPGNELLQPDVARQVEAVVAEQAGRQVHPVTHAAFEEVPWHLFGTLAVGRSQLSFRTPYMDNRIVELAYRAPAHLRHTAEPALRLIHENDSAMAAIPTDRGLSWGAGRLTQAARRAYCAITFKLDYWHKEGLPDALTPLDGFIGSLSHVGMLGLHKFLAYRLWFQGPLAQMAEEVIADGRTKRLPFWEPGTLEKIVPEHRAGRRSRLRDIHAVLTLEAVHRNLMDHNAYPTAETVAAQGELKCLTP